jgi:hypothetical protein
MLQPMRTLRLLLALAALCAAPAHGAFLELLTADVAQPIYLTHAGDDRLFLVEREGAIRVLEGGAVLPTPFLDLGAQVDARGEGGLLSIAFHPDYATHGAFYVSYTTDDPVTGFTSVVSRFHVSSGDPNLADPSEAVLLRLPQPFTNHNGGQIAFGPDGRLYVGFGDGGDRDDPGCRAQKKDTWHGKLLRLDVDPTGTTPPHYAIPADNPFASGADGVLDEVLDLGLRNPWRFSFDRQSGDLWIGDVGQDAIEEVDRRPAWGAGAPGSVNWGWKVEEGNQCTDLPTASCDEAPPACGSGAYADPVDQYPHLGGNRSITGGYVYRGALAPAFLGTYVFGDFGSGRIFALREVAPGEWQRSTLLDGGPQWASFGEGSDGELYALDLAGGAVYHLNLAEAISAADRACIVGMNRAFAKLAKARAAQLRRCLARAGAGREAAEACAAAADAKVAKAAAATGRVEAERCALLPPFGASDAATVNAAAGAADLELLRDVLGPDLDLALVPKASDANAARCQAQVASQLQRCQARRVKEFVACKERGLRDGSVTGATALAACLDADPKGKLAAQCDAASGALARKVLRRHCVLRGVDLGAAFLGCATANETEFAGCAERVGRCRACLALGAADALGPDCDAFDDASANLSCVE